MNALKLAYILTLGMALVAVVMIVGAPAPTLALPPLSDMIGGNGQGWHYPPIGGPKVDYVIDQETGTSWLIERDRWMGARYIDSRLDPILNSIGDPQ